VNKIAQPRLLARRAGAALQPLFIDEGFGTQDAHGRENLVVHKIKDEFVLVLVITQVTLNYPNTVKLLSGLISLSLE